MRYFKPHLRRVRLFCMLLTAMAFGFGSQGCAAGNYNITRIVANWNIKLNVLLRVLVYIVFVFTVYPVAALLDVVIFNTIEFWTQSPVIKAENKRFEKDGKVIEIAHRRNPHRHTMITVTEKNGTQTVSEIRETASGSIDVLVNGERKTEIKGIDNDVVTIVEYANNHEISSRNFDTKPFQSLPIESITANVNLIATALHEPMTDSKGVLTAACHR